MFLWKFLWFHLAKANVIRASHKMFAYNLNEWLFNVAKNSYKRNYYNIRVGTLKKQLYQYELGTLRAFV